MITNQCPNCTHLFENVKGMQCLAFPLSIPEEILTGEFDHRKLHPKQKIKVLFKEIKYWKKK